MEEYLKMAKDLGLENAVLISGDQICFDPRAIHKCRWGCEYGLGSESCRDRNMSPETLQEAVRAYKHVLVLHGHDINKLYKASLKIEQQAFADGNYFAATLGNCNFCKECQAQQGKACTSPESVRACPEGNGVDVFKTVRQLGLPVNTLKTRDDMPNRYTFVLIR
jgi:predicted metal-binding protein